MLIVWIIVLILTKCQINCFHIFTRSYPDTLVITSSYNLVLLWDVLTCDVGIVGQIYSRVSDRMKCCAHVWVTVAVAWVLLSCSTCAATHLVYLRGLDWSDVFSLGLLSSLDMNLLWIDLWILLCWLGFLFANLASLVDFFFEFLCPIRRRLFLQWVLWRLNYLEYMIWSIVFFTD